MHQPWRKENQGNGLRDENEIVCLIHLGKKKTLKYLAFFMRSKKECDEHPNHFTLKPLTDGYNQ